MPTKAANEHDLHIPSISHPQELALQIPRQNYSSINFPAFKVTAFQRFAVTKFSSYFPC
jgi:hypothetical protein